MYSILIHHQNQDHQPTPVQDNRSLNRRFISHNDVCPTHLNRCFDSWANVRPIKTDYAKSRNQTKCFSSKHLVWTGRSRRRRRRRLWLNGSIVLFIVCAPRNTVFMVFRGAKTMDNLAGKRDWKGMKGSVNATWNERERIAEKKKTERVLTG